MKKAYLCFGIILLCISVAGKICGQENEKEMFRFYDVGHVDNPLMEGFSRLTLKDMYNAEKGFGWIYEGTRGSGGENLVERPLKAPTKWKYFDDDLTVDNIFWRGGKDTLKFRMDLPNGKYNVGIYIGWGVAGAIYDWAPFEIGINGKIAFKTINKSTRESFRKFMFHGFDDSFEWNPSWTSEIIWKKFFETTSVEKIVLPVTVKDNYAVIDFHMKNGGALGRKGRINSLIPICAIIACPEKYGEETFRGIDKDRKEQVTSRIKIVTNKKEFDSSVAPKSMVDKGYVVFRQNFSSALYPYSLPEEGSIGQDVTLSLAQGQRDSCSFAIRPLKDLKDVQVELSALKSSAGNTISSDNIEITWLRYMLQPTHYMRRKDSFRPVPKLMRTNKKMDLQKGINRQYAFSITAPENIMPGEYTAEVSIRSSNAPITKFKLKVDVYPFKMETYPDDDERIWIYYAGSFYKRYSGLMMTEEEKWRAIDKDMAFMKKRYAAPTFLFNWKAGDEEIIKFMELYKKHNFRGYAIFGGYRFLNEIYKVYNYKTQKKFNIDFYINKAKHVLAMAKKYDWPEVCFYTVAETKGGMPAWEGALEQLRKFKEAVPDAKLVVLPSHVEEAEVMLEGVADIVGLNAISMRDETQQAVHESGKKLWFYAWGRERFRCGIVDWRLGNRGAVKEWYSAIKRMPFNPFDSQVQDSWNDAPPFIGPNGPVSTPGMEDMAAARTDFFYLATHDLWIDRAEKNATAKSSEALKNAKAIVAEMKSRIKPDYYYYYQRKKLSDFKNNFYNWDKEKVFGWKFSEYALLRKRLAKSIIALKKACGKL